MDIHEGMVIDGAKLLYMLGSGESGEVWSALADDSTVIALKVYSDGKDAGSKADYEHRMAGVFNHTNILMPLGMTSFGSRPVIRLPYCEGRSVDGIAAHISEIMVWHLIADIGSALSEIHRMGYGHFDVKPSNILWDGKKFLLTDFGACRELKEAAPEETAQDASSYRFDAPELKTKGCSASDIWSLGATIFYLYMGCNVFNGLGGRAQRKDSPVPYMRKALPVLSQLVQRCLSFDPEMRPTADEVQTIAMSEIQKLEKQSNIRGVRPKVTESLNSGKKEFWPEQMIEMAN